MANLFIRHADICKTFSNPKRLEIINALRDGKELSASELLKLMDISKAFHSTWQCLSRKGW